MLAFLPETVSRMLSFDEPDMSRELLWIVAIGGLILGLLMLAAVCYLVYFLFSLPMRRQERVQFLLDYLETAETTPEALADPAFAALSDSEELQERFRNLSDRLARGYRIDLALAELPRLLPPQIQAILEVGVHLRDVRKVIPACRKWLSDSTSRVTGAANYLPPITLLLCPSGIVTLAVVVHGFVPRLRHQFDEILTEEQLPALTAWVFQHHTLIVAGQVALILVLGVLALLYVGGPLLAYGFGPITDRVAYWLPWRRKRLQRDFSSMLAILLDADVPEADAVTLAARSTANRILIRRAEAVVAELKSGVHLVAALQKLDDSGELAWRLRTAAHGENFLQALTGWHDKLEAKAYQQEQAAAQLFSTVIVVANGALVGLVAAATFRALMESAHQIALW